MIMAIELTVSKNSGDLSRCMYFIFFSLFECIETDGGSCVNLCLHDWLPWLHIPVGICSGPAVHDDPSHLLLLRLCSKVTYAVSSL